MKIVTVTTTLAAVVTIATYFGISPRTEAEQPTFSIGSNSSGNNQINNTGPGSVIVDSGHNSKITSTCIKDNLYITKSGYYGAVNPKAYSKLDDAVRNNNEKILEKLLVDKMIISLPGGTAACVQEIAFESYRKQISIPNSQFTYWVSDDAVEKVK